MGYLISSIVATKFGWESVFYTFANAGCVWFIFWVLLVFDSPDVHPTITEVCMSFITMKCRKINKIRRANRLNW